MNRSTFGLFLILIMTTFQLQAQSTCNEKKIGRSYVQLCEQNITTEKKKILIQTQAIPKKIDGKNTYKLVSFYTYDRKKVETDELFLTYSKFLKNLEQLTVYINGKLFTGKLHLAIPFINEGKEELYDGYDLQVFEFKEGKFVSKSKLSDIELEKEKAIER